MAAREPLLPLGSGKDPLRVHPRNRLDRSVTPAAIEAMAKRTCNWGRWGPDDELGTLNHITPDDVVAASRLIRKGKVFSLALPFDQNGPQAGDFTRRFNPIHTMLATGVDAAAGCQQALGIGYADDMVSMPLQCGTQWDALSHVFYGDRMWNGYDARLVDSNGAARNGIERTRDRMVGRGVLLDIPRHKGADCLADGYGIGIADLEECAAAQGVAVGRGDFVIVRTGQMERCLWEGAWGGYAGGDAPGLRFETAEWVWEKRIAGIATDTWGCEVRPNESTEATQPWHWVVIPMIGVSMGEIFNLAALAADCAADGIYEFLFVAPPLPITGAVGSPINPQAIK